MKGKKRIDYQFKVFGPGKKTFLERAREGVGELKEEYGFYEARNLEVPDLDELTAHALIFGLVYGIQVSGEIVFSVRGPRRYEKIYKAQFTNSQIKVWER